MNDFWTVSQLFEGYGGYVYEVVNPCSGVAYYLLAFNGDKFPSENDKCEVCFDLRDGIYFLKNGESKHDTFIREAKKRLKQIKSA